MQRLPLWLALVAVAGIAVGAAQAHGDEAYWHDSGPTANYPDWMSALNDDAILADVSIPGSHDSGTYPGLGADLIAGFVASGAVVGLLTPLCPPCLPLLATLGPIILNDATQTQTMNIADSLKSGIRYFDIRLRHYDYPFKRDCNDDYSSSACDLHVFHGPFPYTTKFQPDVLDPIMTFLVTHPTEFVLMKVAKEGDGDTDVTGALEDLLSGSFEVNGVTYQYEDFFLPSNADADPAQNGLQFCGVGDVKVGPTFATSTPPAATPPAGCTARGKLLLLPTGSVGTLAADHYFRSLAEAVPSGHDNWRSVGTNWDLHDYFQERRDFLHKANNDTDHSALYVNQILTSGGGFPYFFASGHSSPATDAPRLSTGLVTAITADFWDTYPWFPRVACLANIFDPGAPFCTIAFEGLNTMTADYLSDTDIGTLIPDDWCSDHDLFWYPGWCMGRLVDLKNFRAVRPDFHTSSSRVGIVLADFPGKRLIEAVANVNPGVDLGGVPPPPVPRLSQFSYVGDEGTPITFDASATTDGNGEPDSSLTYVWTIKENGDTASGCTRVDGQGPQIYQAAADLFASAHPSLTGADLAQAFQASPEGKAAQAALDNDPGDTSTAKFVCADNTSATAEVTVFDGPASASTTAPVTINNVAPVAVSTSADTSVVSEGGEATVTLAFTDAGAQDTHTCTFDWRGGGAPKPVTVVEPGSSPGSCSSTQTFASSGVYSIKVVVLDDDGDSATDPLGVLIAVLRVTPVTGNLRCSNVLFGATTISGNVTVPAGKWCALIGTQVHGNLTAANTNGLRLDEATIAGNVEISGLAGVAQFPPPPGQTWNVICRSTIRGNVQVTEGHSPISIGDAVACTAGNSIWGNTRVSSNAAPVRVSRNSIRGNLECTSNTPAVAGVPGSNNTRGSKTGQCAGL